PLDLGGQPILVVADDRLTELLERFGVELIGKSVIGDDEDRLAAEIQRRMADADLLLITGGLGPTEDDRTRAAVARAVGRETAEDPALVEWLRGRFRSFGREMPEVNRRQAQVIDGARVLENPRGTAPGQHVEKDGRHAFLFPGVPREVDGMVKDHLRPWLESRLGEASLERRVIKVAGVGESHLEELLAPVYERFGGEAIAVLASPGEVRVVIQAQGSPEERAAELDPMADAIRAAVGRPVFGEGADATLEGVVIQSLGARGLTVSTAESCTGGLIGERLTRVPGSSAAYIGGVVAYADVMKTLQLGVDPDVIAAHGAVSGPVVEAMATGARERFGTDLAVAVSGVAGPGGGTEEKPVGTVYLAVAGPGDGAVKHRRVVLPGDRQRIRQLTSQLALEMIRRRLLDGGTP
ncbi:MAG: competence/damage-inducible protein A, partial [Acidobacteriota bacterium]